MAKLLHIISRKRPLENEANRGKGGGAELEKCLTTLDLISLGVGSCCGAGVYLTAGIIASTKAGPGGVVSLMLAGLVSVLTGFHYAELAGMCPQTSGSAYMYAYLTVGELSAFVIGWGLVVEYVIGTAAAAVALSETLDSLLDKEISTFINSHVHKVGIPRLDVLAAVVCLLLMWLLASGVQMSARVNNILNGLNLASWLVFVGAAYSLGSSNNWTQHGGFWPFGFQGVLTAIPTAYYAFVGFDGLATTGAECTNPVKSIPISIIASIIINIIVFTSVVIGLTLNVPYNLLPADTAVLDVFVAVGYPALKYVLAVGAVSGLFAATFGSLFPLPRILQAMSQDGVFFRYFAHVCPKRHTAVRATIMSGLVATFLSAFVELTLLIELVLIGTLLAYVIVTFATLILRYIDLGHTTTSTNQRHSRHTEFSEITPIITSCAIKRKSSDTNLSQMKSESLSRTTSRQNSGIGEDTCQHADAFNLAFECDDSDRHVHPRRNSSNGHPHKHECPDSNTTGGSTECTQPSYVFTEATFMFDMADPAAPPSRHMLMSKWWGKCLDSVVLYLERHVVILLLTLYGCLTLTCAILAHLFEEILKMNIAVIVLMAVLTFLLSSMTVCLMLLPQIKHTESTRVGFQTPLVPMLTLTTAGVNIYLMASLSWVTWLLFLAWLILGLSIYFLYGARHSNLNNPRPDHASDLDIVPMELLNDPETTDKENAPLLLSSR